MAEPQPKRDVAVLRGFDASGREVVRHDVDLHEYWDELHPLIDNGEHRRSLGVVRLVGDLYGDDGLLQHFDNRYDESGRYIGGRIEHADGTVTEDQL